MTPLYDVLKQYAGKNPARFHMPGHKGVFLPIPELMGAACLDVTELPATGNLYVEGEPFDSAQRLWAERFGFEYCQFLTGGSTMGIHTAFALCCQPGDQVLIDRNCHRSVFNALALLELEPVYLERPWLCKEGLIGPVSPADVEKQFNLHPEIKTVCITSPTYSGILSDIAAIGGIVKSHGGKLFVDGAHGAHLPFLGVNAFEGADVVVVSAHKTLPAMGQTALLFTTGFDPDLVRLRASIYGTSSPSYVLLASLDAARQWMEDGGELLYHQAAERVARLRKKFPCLSGELSLDPTRLTLCVRNGPDFTKRMEEQNIYPEMEDGGHVVLICTPQDLEENLDRLEQALERLTSFMGSCPPLPPPPLPRRVLSVRKALFSPSVTSPLEDCEGKVSACQVAPYPPGVPVVAPGEVISKKELAYLKQIGYNVKSEVRVVDSV